MNNLFTFGKSTTARTPKTRIADRQSVTSAFTNSNVLTRLHPNASWCRRNEIAALIGKNIIPSTIKIRMQNKAAVSICIFRLIGISEYE